MDIEFLNKVNGMLRTLIKKWINKGLTILVGENMYIFIKVYLYYMDFILVL